MTSLHYLSTSRLPSQSANAVHVARMSAALTALGLDVTLHGLEGQGSEAEVRAWYGIGESIAIRRWSERETFLPRALWTARQALPFVRVGPLPSLLHGRLAIGPALAAARPGIIYARNLHWLAGFHLPGVPVIAESHHPPRGRLDRLIQARLLQRPEVAGLVVITQALKRLYLDTYPWLDSRRVIVAADAADDPSENEVGAPGQSGGRLQVGYVGQLYRGRGAELIMELARRLPGMDFHLVGGRQEQIDMLAANGVPENLTFHGHQPHAALARFYRGLDVVLAPYQRSVAVEGNAGDTSAFMSPLKIFEYMAWGRAIIASDLPVLREVLDPGWNAVLLPPEDPAAWGQALEMLAADPARRQALAAAARARFLERHSWTGRARAILEAAGLAAG